MITAPRIWRTSKLKRILPFLLVAIIVFIGVQYGTIFRRRRLPPGYPQDNHPFPKPNFVSGTPKPPGSTYSKTLIIPRLKDDDVSWIHKEMPWQDAAIYVVDDPNAPLHPPKNKGHEVMVYLSYIIDHYDDLPDVMVFMHSHRYAWHNEEPLDMDAVQLIRRLSSERVVREGFMNLRCNWSPGCPDWIHPRSDSVVPGKQEEPMFERAWGELFPFEPVPETLAGACCAQFALSRERVRSIPKSRYIYYRDWLLLTDLSDYISGRVWEYLWHAVFTGQNVFCPLQHICYCDGFGLCFGGEEEFNNYARLYWDIRGQQHELKDWHDKAQAIETARKEGKMEELAKLQAPEQGKDIWLGSEINRKIGVLYRTKIEALNRGQSAEQRAKEAGRPWKPGDGF